RSAGSWVDDGFTADDVIQVSGSRENDGWYTVDAVTATTLTLSSEATLTAGGPDSGVSVLRNPRLTLNDNGTSLDTITRSEGDGVDDGFSVGDVIALGGSDLNKELANDKLYTVTDVKPDTLTLSVGDSLKPEGPTPDLIVVRRPKLTLADNGPNPDTITR